MQSLPIQNCFFLQKALHKLLLTSWKFKKSEVSSRRVVGTKQPNHLLVSIKINQLIFVGSKEYIRQVLWSEIQSSKSEVATITWGPGPGGLPDEMCWSYSENCPEKLMTNETGLHGAPTSSVPLPLETSLPRMEVALWRNVRIVSSCPIREKMNQFLESPPLKKLSCNPGWTWIPGRERGRE